MTTQLQHEYWDRLCIVSIGNAEWADLHVTFSVSRTASSKPSPATIRIDNLSKESRAAILRDTSVRLVAGYAGMAGQVFSGQVTEVRHQKTGPGWTTTVVAGDGRSAWRQYVSRSWTSGTPYKDLVQELAGQMGLAVSDSALQLVQGGSRGPVAMSGFAHREMDLLMASLGLQWSIQDGALQVVKPTGGTVQPAIVLGPRTGLVGSPEVLESKKTRVKGSDGVFRTVTRPTIKAISLLNPGYAPGRQVLLQSDQHRGHFRVDRVDHRGDTHGADFTSELYLSEVL